MKLFFLLLFSVWAPVLASAETPSIIASPETAFDRQVLDTVLGRGLTEVWDVNGAANRFNPGLPVAIHFSEWGAPVELGEALQQRAINEPFELVVGFYEKLPNSTEATVVAVHDIKIQPEQWQKLWGKTTLEELKRLNDSFKTGSDKGALFYASGEASRIRMKGSVIQVDPRIKKNKREIYCYIPFAIFHKQLLDDPVPKRQQGLTLWGQPFKSKIDLGTRPQENVVATIDKNGNPVLPKNVAVKKADKDPIEVKSSKVVLNEGNRLTPSTDPLPPSLPKATPQEIEAAILAAQKGLLTPTTPGVIPEQPKAPPPPADTGWQRIDTEPVKIK